MKYNHPLMEENVNKEDIASLIQFLSQDPLPQFTNGPKVREFESEWGKWLGTKHNTMVGSGSMANELTFLILKHLYPEGGEVLVTGLGWVSDIAAILHNGFTPVFCDIDLKNFSIDQDEIKKKMSPKTRAILLVHILGFNGLTDDILDICERHSIKLIEDVCESHGATFRGKKVGTYGDISNFSYFYAHHLCSFAEGGMICTNNDDLHNLARAFRSHGMNREVPDETFRNRVISENPELNKDFIFLAASHNGRSQEANAVVALNQLKRLDANNLIRANNLNHFLGELNPGKYITNLDTNGNSNYAFTVVQREKSFELRNKTEKTLTENGIEFRRGLSGGGNQMRQPYLNLKFQSSDFPNIEHVHHFSWYIGNYPTLKREKIDTLAQVLNNI